MWTPSWFRNTSPHRGQVSAAARLLILLRPDEWLKEKKHHEEGGVWRSVCHFLFEGREISGTKEDKKNRLNSEGGGGFSAVTWRPQWASPCHGCRPCQSNERWRSGGWGWSVCSAVGGGHQCWMWQQNPPKTEINLPVNLSGASVIVWPHWF